MWDWKGGIIDVGLERGKLMWYIRGKGRSVDLGLDGKDLSRIGGED